MLSRAPVVVVVSTLVILLILFTLLTQEGALSATSGSTLGHKLHDQHTNHHPVVQPPLATPYSELECSTYLYAYVDHSMVEMNFLLSTILPEVRGSCGACVRLRPRAAFVEDAKSTTSCSPMLLAASMDLYEHEVEALRANPEKARQRVLVFHYSDEHEDRTIPAGGYTLPRLLLRNYYSEGKDRLVDLTYLQEGGGGGPLEVGNFAAGTAPGAPPAKHIWAPLGHTDHFAANLAPLLNVPIRSRPYAWSWSGSKDGKWARDYFLRGIEEFPRKAELLASGRLHVYSKFMEDGGVLRSVEYSSWLYQSRVAPCPNGGSAEQFRIWEALEAGAVPLLPKDVHPYHLKYFEALDLKALWVDQSHWHEHAQPILLAASTNDTFIGELEAMQRHNNRVLPGIYKRLQFRVGAEVCAAAGMECTGNTALGYCPKTADVAAPRCDL